MIHVVAEISHDQSRLDNSAHCCKMRRILSLRSGVGRSGGLGCFGQTIGIARLPEQAQPAPGNGQRGGSWPTRPSIDSRMRSAWPLWRAYSSIMLSRM